jgi:hypothetical protein
MSARYEYKIVQVREKLLSSAMSAPQLEKLINSHAREGWQLKAVTSVDVKGRLGGETQGVLLTFERPVQELTP